MKQIIKKMIKIGKIPYYWFEIPFWHPRADSNKIRQLKDKFKGQRCLCIKRMKPKLIG